MAVIERDKKGRGDIRVGQVEGCQLGRQLGERGNGREPVVVKLVAFTPGVGHCIGDKESRQRIDSLLLARKQEERNFRLTTSWFLRSL